MKEIANSDKKDNWDDLTREGIFFKIMHSHKESCVQKNRTLHLSKC